jgi:3-oxoacyl-[acyl-carrier-protein] synthase-3
MEDLLSRGQLNTGDRALLAGFGAGLTYAAQVVRLP